MDPAVARERKIERFRRERAGRERLQVGVGKRGARLGLGVGCRWG